MKRTIGAAAAIGMLILILDTRTAITGRFFLTLAAQNSGEVTLAQHLMGPNAERSVFTGGEPGRFHRFRFKIRMLRQKRGNCLLVLRRGKGAGGIHQPPAGSD